MRPDIRVPRQLDGRIKDFAEEHDRDWRDVYREALEYGIDRLEDEATEGLTRQDVRASVRGDFPELRDDEIDAVVAAWAFVRDEGVVAPKEFREHVHPDHKAGKNNADHWWSKLSDAIEAVPGVDRESQRRFVWTGN